MKTETNVPSNRSCTSFHVFTWMLSIYFTVSGMLTCRYFSVMEVGLSFISSAATLAFEKLKNVKLESDAII